MGEPIEVVELGHILAIEVHPRGKAAFCMRWSQKTAEPLYWCETQKCLLFAEVKPRKRKAASASDVQFRIYKKWHDSEPNAARIETYPLDAAGKWVEVGVVRRIDYHSTKWEDDQEYEHRLGGGSKLYRLGTGPAAIYAVSGKIRATARGLIK